MADDADRADSRIEEVIADGIAKARRESDSYLPSIGVCHWCESPVSHGRVSCSRECHHDHGKCADARKRNGG